MALWDVRVGAARMEVEAANKVDAKLKAARSYVRKYPNANLDTHKILTQYKFHVRRI